GAATLTMDGGFRNDGIVSVTAPFPVTINGAWGGYISQDGGSIVGTQYLDWRGDNARSFDWTGGTISANANDSTKAVLRLFGSLYTHFLNPAVSGRIDIIGNWSQSYLVGQIGAGVRVRLASLPVHEFRLVRD